MRLCATSFALLRLNFCLTTSLNGFWKVCFKDFFKTQDHLIVLIKLSLPAPISLLGRIAEYNWQYNDTLHLVITHQFVLAIVQYRPVHVIMFCGTNNYNQTL